MLGAMSAPLLFVAGALLSVGLQFGYMYTQIKNHTADIDYLGKQFAELWRQIKILFQTDIAPGLDKAFQDIDKNYKESMLDMSTATKSYWDVISQQFHTGANDIIDAVNAVIRALNSIHFNFPGIKIGGQTIGAFSFNGFGLTQLPHFDTGGYVPNTGIAMLHEGEFVLSKAMLAGKQSVPNQVSNTTNYKQPITIYATVNSDIDMNLLGQKIAFAVRNSR
jgi:hypothetical protein